MRDCAARAFKYSMRIDCDTQEPGHEAFCWNRLDTRAGNTCPAIRIAGTGAGLFVRAGCAGPSGVFASRPGPDAGADRALSRCVAGTNPDGLDLPGGRGAGRAVFARISATPRGRRGASGRNLWLGPERQLADGIPAVAGDDERATRLDGAIGRSIPRPAIAGHGVGARTASACLDGGQPTVERAGQRGPGRTGMAAGAAVSAGRLCTVLRSAADLWRLVVARTATDPVGALDRLHAAAGIFDRIFPGCGRQPAPWHPVRQV